MSITFFIAVAATLVIFLLVMGIASLLQSGSDKAEKRVKSRLQSLAMSDMDAASIDLVLRETSMSTVPWFNRFLEKMRWAANVNKLIKQADAKGSAGVYLLLCALLAIVGFYVGILSDRIWVSFVLAFIFGNIPLWRLKMQKRKRVDRFQTQLPEALDLMARALKAGHTFGGGMRMVADEFNDPIAGEFRQTLDEINYGMDADRALYNLLERVDSTDLKFFVVSVNIQRETGGNLSEIMDKISSLVRERFVLFGKIKVLSAEGRLSALILVLLPFALAGVLYIVNPGYISLLWTRELGQGMAWSAVILLAVGVFFTRKIVRIEV